MFGGFDRLTSTASKPQNGMMLVNSDPNHKRQWELLKH